jgi:hypothetical protein
MESGNSVTIADAMKFIDMDVTIPMEKPEIEKLETSAAEETDDDPELPPEEKAESYEDDPNLPKVSSTRK